MEGERRTLKRVRAPRAKAVLLERIEEGLLHPTSRDVIEAVRKGIATWVEVKAAHKKFLASVERGLGRLR